MAGEEPLLSQRPSSEISNDRIEEEDALLTGERTTRNGGNSPRTWKFWREVTAFVWAILATAALICVTVLYGQSSDSSDGSPSSHPAGKKSLIFMVSDGMVSSLHVPSVHMF
jgi:alkaline phosphatase